MVGIKSPKVLLESVPGILGFTPEESAVMVLLNAAAEVIALFRVDLADVGQGVEQLADTATRAGAVAVVAALVSEQGARCVECEGEFLALAVGLNEALAQRNVTVVATLVVDKLAAGGRWYCVDQCGVDGVLDDPAVSPVAVAAVVEGRRMYRSRAELAATVHADTARARMLAPLLSGPVAVEDAAAAARDAVAAVRRMADGSALTDVELAGVGAVLVDKGVRDRLFGVAVSAVSDEAEELWALLARVLPGRWRVEALTLLAFSAYSRGDGPLAGVALDEALSVDSDHTMAGMLSTALTTGIKPDKIRSLVSAMPPMAI